MKKATFRFDAPLTERTRRTRHPAGMEGNAGAGRQYDTFEASTLFCPHCRMERPVRKRLLLVLPGEDRYDYDCAACGRNLGGKVEKHRPGTLFMP